MSSGGVILNGGTAEHFILGSTVEGLGGNQDSSPGAAYDAWEPEDLVATVQFLATLDDRLPGYVLPGSDHQVIQQPDRLSSGSSSICEQDIGHQHSYPGVDVNSSGNMERQTGDDEVIEPATTPTSSNTLIPEDVVVPCAAALSDITAEENSISSSAAQTPCSTEERSIIRPSNKPTHLKRVSFGSTKGSMVETLIYESSQTEEEPSTTPAGWTKSVKNKNLRSVIGTVPDSLPEETISLLSESSRSASKVRVTYFESKRPLTLPSPEASDAEWDDMAEPPPHQQSNYIRQTSTESGQDNPFRPDGDLSREADELVELLKGGRPISEVLKSQEDAQHEHSYQPEPTSSAEQAVALSGSPRNASAPSSPASKADSTDGGRINGNVTEQEKKSLKESPGDGGSVEVQRAVVAPVAGESQVEHVVIKKKSKCQCCVIQ